MQLGLTKLVGVDINPEDIRKIARRMGPLYGATPSAGKQKKRVTVPSGLQTLWASLFIYPRNAPPRQQAAWEESTSW